MNWFLASQCLFYYLYRSKAESNNFTKLWNVFFLLFSFSTFFGGLSHLLFHYTGLQGKIPGWGTAVIAISCIEWAIASKISEPGRRNLNLLIWIKLVITFLTLLWDLHFKWVMIHTGVGLILILGIWSIISLRNGKESSKFFLWGIAWAIAPLPVRIFEIDLHDWFNRDDISHLFMLISIYFFHRGVQNS